MNAKTHSIILETASFAELREAREAALAAERGYDATANFSDPAQSEESDRLTDIRYGIEDRLIAAPSPDATAVAYKFLVAHGEGRNADCWDGIIEAEAKRFANHVTADPHMGWLAERDRLLTMANTVGHLTDDESDALIARANQIEERIYSTPATTANGILAKALLQVGCESVPGFSDRFRAERVFEEAKAMGLIRWQA